MLKTIFHSVRECFAFFCRLYLQYQKKQKAQDELLQKQLRIRYYRKQRWAQTNVTQHWWKLGLLLFCYLPVQGQQMIKPLKIGDTLPEQLWQQPLNVTNSQQSNIKLENFKGKLIILDFWATWCGACVSAFEQTDELQKEFGDQLLFIPVTYQERKEVAPFLNKLKQLKQLNLTSVVEDQTLKAYFPNQTLPYYVWIGPDGKVAAITDLKEVNKVNIQQLLKGKDLQVEVKSDVSIPYNRNQPLFLNGNGSDGNNLKYHSLLASYTAGLPLQSSVKTEALMGRKITGLNQPLLNLYRLAYRDHGYITVNRTILEVDHPEKFNTHQTGSNYLKWLEAGNGYCYELLVPPSLIEQSWSFMQQDLGRYFPAYDASIEMRSTDCLVLKRTTATDLIKSKGGPAVMEMTRLGAHIRNEPLSGWLFKMVALYFQNLSTPVLDESGYKGNIDLDINAEMTDVAAVNKQLEKYGLQFVEATRPAEYLVIKDIK